MTESCSTTCLSMWQLARSSGAWPDDPPAGRGSLAGRRRRRLGAFSAASEPARNSPKGSRKSLRRAADAAGSGSLRTLRERRPLVGASLTPPALPPFADRRNKWPRKEHGLPEPHNGGGSQASDARIRTLATQPTSFGEFRGGAFGLASERVGSGEVGVNETGSRISVSRSFEPWDRIVDPRLQEMPSPIRKYQFQMLGSRGLSRMACS